jgi:hypothetical protein
VYMYGASSFDAYVDGFLSFSSKDSM